MPRHATVGRPADASVGGGAKDCGRPQWLAGGGGPEGHAASPPSGTDAGPAAAAVAAGGTGGGNGLPRRGRWADEEPPCDRFREEDGSDYADYDVAAEDEAMDDAEEIDEDDAWTRRPTAEDLKSSWLQECRAVKALERVERADREPSSALLAARQARDDAERRWRQLLAPKPVAVRMGYAQKKLERAQRAVDRAHQDLRAFDEEAQRRWTELQDAIKHAEDRRDARQAALDELHQEAGDLASQRREAGHADGNKVRDLVAKELQAFVESLDEGSDARSRANLLLAKVANAVDAAEYQQYSICTDGEGECDDDGDAFQTVTRRARTQQRPQPAQDLRRPCAWSTNAQGRWNRSATTPVANGFSVLAERDATHEGCGTEAADRANVSGCTKPTPREQAVTPSSASASEAANSGKGRKNAREHADDDAPQPPSGKSHRGEDELVAVSVEAAGDDRARAAKLKQEQDAAIAAAREAGASFGDEASVQIAGQLYAHKVQLVADRAKAAGVEPSCEGRPLIGLAPQELNKWVQAVLDPAEAAARAGAVP